MKKEKTTGPGPGQAPPSADVLLRFIATKHAGARRLNLPPILSPKMLNLQKGVAVEGKILRVIPSPMSMYKQRLVVMEHPEGGEFSFPLVATLRRALAAELKVEDNDKIDLTPLIGKTLIISGLGKVPTKDRKRSVNLLDVMIAD